MKLPIQCSRNDIFVLSFCNQEINQIDTYAYTFPKDTDSIVIYIYKNAMCQQQCHTLSIAIQMPHINSIGQYIMHQQHWHIPTPFPYKDNTPTVFNRLIDWCLTPTLAVLQIFRGVNKF